ncbi:MAG: PD-(D/E)XK nuclease family protein [Bacteroidaceae bacterium]|nr:PD-(D/E)XK nuclease family protein [Bacteroidaceae bacterium]
MAETNIDNIDSIVELLELYDIIQDVKEEERKKLPYRLNVLIDANPLEPDVSRILAGFFMQKTNGDYRVLKDFVRTFWGDSLAAMITNPTISTEETVKGDYRIDILIYEKDKYSIVLENKIWEAVDQPHQLANYIDAMLSSRYGFSMDQIYVAFLPKTKDHHPSSNSWKFKRMGTLTKKYSMTDIVS